MALREEGYWERHYEEELRNYLEDGDEGEIWFGKQLSRKIVDWLLTRFGSLAADTGEHWKRNINVVDIGCGNSFLLCCLAERFNGQLGRTTEDISLSALGLDYSANSISLSSRIVQDRQLSGQIALQECDILDQTQVDPISGKCRFSFIIDKGTFDAICLLNGHSEAKLEQAREAYLRSVKSLASTGSILVLASCNHTEDELVALFGSKSGPEGLSAKLIDRIGTPSIQFGGRSGSQVTCLIFELFI